MRRLCVAQLAQLLFLRLLPLRPLLPLHWFSHAETLLQDALGESLLLCPVLHPQFLDSSTLLHRWLAN